MNETANAITQLSTTLGPVGAVCAVMLIASGLLNLYLLKRLFTIQDKLTDSAVAEATMHANLLNGFQNMGGAFDRWAQQMHNPKG